MNSLTKFIGTIIIFFGLILLMWCFDNKESPLLEIILISTAGITTILMGLICWLWYEPYED